MRSQRYIPVFASLLLLAAADAGPVPATAQSEALCGSLDIPCRTTATSEVDFPAPVVVDDHLKLLPPPERKLRLSTKSRYLVPDEDSSAQSWRDRTDDNVPLRTAWESKQLRSGNRQEASTCKVVNVQLLARHGTRNPNGSDLKQYLDLRTKLATTYTPPPPPAGHKYSFLTNFTAPCDFAMTGMLTTQGEVDSFELGRRLKEKYAHLVSDVGRIEWQTTNVSRTITSGRAFQQGLFAHKHDQDVAFSSLQTSIFPNHQDPILRPYDCCKRYENATENPPLPLPGTTFAQRRYPAIIARLARDALLHDLTIHDVTIMFKLCAFEYTIQGKEAGFCSLFTDEELALNDFAVDLNLNYYRAYGLEGDVNEWLACPLLTKIFGGFDETIAAGSRRGGGTPNHPMAAFRFGHAETLTPLISTLGLFRDPHSPKGIQPHWTDEQIKARVFRGAEFSPFGGNFIFELLECPASQELDHPQRHHIANDRKTYKVRALVGEQPVVIPGCEGREACPIHLLKQALAGKIGCDFDGKCQNF
ncbi:histidine phosphatase superfamily [Fimicolochytrium jonesii]|uniref:histidine phosphatase superfamily n=1 Tax=Fimicolochytrium jonesii TaxID=1396493 RepID=UPI0022FE6225|nr:histidine phosphatase superfamily [Fimicolochytrium jonesii]KAI8821673.1 histidine phosphatase superfamily [Fimicolochytrium jonesii]